MGIPRNLAIIVLIMLVVGASAIQIVGTFTGLVSAQANTPQLSITLTTAQPQYQPNSMVEVQGQVTDATGDAVASASVALQVDSPTGNEIFYSSSIVTNTAGTFQTQVPLGSSSPPGTYTVFASASKLGYSNITTSTAFVVGTSTTPSVIIQAVYAGDSAGNPVSSFKSGQEVWVWVVVQNIGAAFQGIVWVEVQDPNGVSVQVQMNPVQFQAGQTAKSSISFGLPGNAPTGVYTIKALVSDKLISEGGTFLASTETQFDLTG